MTHAEQIPLAKAVLIHLRTRRHRLITIESCTGGLVCAALTAVAGSSDVIEGAFVTYSNALKTCAAGVSEELITVHGAVSEEVARAMAQGGLAHARNATIALSITGIAGPDGGSAEKPVGTVCFGLSVGDHHSTKRLLFSGDRTAIRLAAVEAGLKMLLDL